MSKRLVKLRNGSVHAATGRMMPKYGGRRRTPRAPSEILVCVAKVAEVLYDSGQRANGLPKAGLVRTCKRFNITAHQFCDYFKGAGDVFNYPKGCVPRKRFGNDVRDPKFMKVYQVIPVSKKKKTAIRPLITKSKKGSKTITVTTDELAAVLKDLFE